MALRSPYKCFHCEAQFPALQPRCPACDRLVDLPEGANHFDVLGVPETLSFDPAALQERFYALSRQTHPDRFATAGMLDQARAARWSTAVNRAYQTLREPLSRAHYVLERHGIATSDKQVPVELAEAYFELQELAEEGNSRALADFRRGLDAQLTELDAGLPHAARAWDTQPEPSQLASIAKKLTLRRFLESMIRDIEKKQAS